jgi:O-antigen/teichoic acid export membrane protein
MSFKRNLISMLSGNFGKIIIQTLFFFLFAKLLGVKDFGVYSSIFALISIAAPFSGLGYGNIVIKERSSNSSNISLNFSNAVYVLRICSIFLSLIVIVITYLVFGNVVSIYFVVLLSINELFLQRYLELIGQCYIAVEKMKITSIIYIVSSLVRLIPLIALPLTDNKLTTWVYLYTILLLIAVFSFKARLSTMIEKHRHSMQKIKWDLKESIYFSIGLSSQNIYNDVDKTIIGKLGTFEFAGLYTMAYKIIELTFFPAKAVLGTTYPKFFKLGTIDNRATLKLTLKLSASLFIYSIIAATLVLLIKPLILYVLGDSYKELYNVLLLLLLIPLLRSIHYPIADAITGIGQQKLRSYIQISIAVFNFVISIIVIRIDQKLVVLGSLLSEGMLLVMLLVTYVYLLRRK